MAVELQGEELGTYLSSQRDWPTIQSYKQDYVLAIAGTRGIWVYHCLYRTWYQSYNCWHANLRFYTASAVVHEDKVYALGKRGYIMVFTLNQEGIVQGPPRIGRRLCHKSGADRLVQSTARGLWLDGSYTIWGATQVDEHNKRSVVRQWRINESLRIYAARLVHRMTPETLRTTSLTAFDDWVYALNNVRLSGQQRQAFAFSCHPSRELVQADVYALPQKLTAEGVGQALGDCTWDGQELVWIAPAMRRRTGHNVSMYLLRTKEVHRVITSLAHEVSDHIWQYTTIFVPGAQAGLKSMCVRGGKCVSECVTKGWSDKQFAEGGPCAHLTLMPSYLIMLVAGFADLHTPKVMHVWTQSNTHCSFALDELIDSVDNPHAALWIG